MRAQSARGSEAMQWSAWMRSLGRHIRRVREFLGMPQEQLARFAGVSQGAVSRLEAGRGLATPLLIVMRVLWALRRAVRTVDPALLSDQARRLLVTDPPYAPGFAPIPLEPGPLLRDPGLEELVRHYRALSASDRQRLLAATRSLAASGHGHAGEPRGAARPRSRRRPRGPR